MLNLFFLSTLLSCLFFPFPSLFLSFYCPLGCVAPRLGIPNGRAKLCETVAPPCSAAWWVRPCALVRLLLHAQSLLLCARRKSLASLHVPVSMLGQICPGFVDPRRSGVKLYFFGFVSLPAFSQGASLGELEPLEVFGWWSGEVTGEVTQTLLPTPLLPFIKL